MGERASAPTIAYMIDQSHNLKGKIEAMIQTVCTAQELYAKAALVDHAHLAKLQDECSLVAAEETLRGAFWVDVRPAPDPPKQPTPPPPPAQKRAPQKQAAPRPLPQPQFQQQQPPPPPQQRPGGLFGGLFGN